MQPLEPFQKCNHVFALELVVQELDAVSEINQPFVGFDPANQARLCRLSPGGTRLPRSRGGILACFALTGA